MFIIIFINCFFQLTYYHSLKNLTKTDACGDVRTKQMVYGKRSYPTIGYTNNVGWSFIYLKNFLLCTACTYNAITTAKKLITLISKVNLYFHNIKHEHSN